MEDLFFCDELLSQILLLLPVKALYRSICVCKRWEYLISSDPIFVKRLNSLPPLISGFFLRPDQRCFVNTFQDVVFYHSDYVASDLANYIKLGFRGLSVWVVDSNKGVLLLAERENPFSMPKSILYFVCNPITRQCIAFPHHGYPRDYENTLLYCYVKENSKAKRTVEFKVINLSRCKKESEEIVIYSSETGKWRMSEITVPKCQYKTVIGNSLFLWNCYHGKNDKVYTYNLKDRSTCSIQLPPVEGQYRKGFFGESAGSVYYVVTSLTAIQASLLVDGIEWSLVHSITNDMLMDALPLRVQCQFYIKAFLSAEQKLLLVKHGASLQYLYHLETRRLKLVNNSRKDNLCTFIPYALPALVPLFGRKSGIMPGDIISELEKARQRSVHNVGVTTKGPNRFEVLNSMEGDLF